jgi:hypothetical protein
MAKDVREGPIKPVERSATARSPLTIKYVDLPEMVETFADSVNSVSFDGQTLRIEFGVTRFDQAAGQKPTSGRRYPASRIVLTRSAALEMINGGGDQPYRTAQANGYLAEAPRRTPQIVDQSAILFPLQRLIVDAKQRGWVLGHIGHGAVFERQFHAAGFFNRHRPAEQAACSR